MFVVGIQMTLAIVGIARQDAALGMLAGLMTPLTLAALGIAFGWGVIRRSQKHS